jgi:hypothetical protein
MNFSAGYVDSVSSPGAMQIVVERAGQNGQKASCPINPAYAPTPKEVMSVTVTSSMRSSSGGVTEQEKLSIEETKATMKFREIMFNEFQILEKLGSGQLGTVYLARWRGALVAVKKLDENDMDEKTVDLFKKEAAALHVLSHHPSLASFIGACWYSTPRTFHVHSKHSNRLSVRDATPVCCRTCASSRSTTDTEAWRARCGARRGST